MIIHTAMIRDELDVLAMAMEELDGRADYHIISEARVDFHGRPKPLHLSEAIANSDPRLWRWKDRIEVVVCDSLPDHPNPWVREHAQRDAMMATLREVAVDDDMVLICDLDEIPSANAIALPPDRPYGLMMRTAHSAVDWLYPWQAPGSVLAPWSVIKGAALSSVRDGRPGYDVVHDGGWHFSWLGGPQKQAEKLAVTCHLELSSEEQGILGSGQGYKDGRHIGVEMVAWDVDETWPAYIRERRCPQSWFRPRPGDGHCRHCSDNNHEPDEDERNCAFYEYPAHLLPATSEPGRKRHGAS